MDTDDGRMVAAVRAELDELEDLAWRRRDAALSALLVDLAERLDRSSSARDGAALARELRNTLAELRKGEPAARTRPA